jgi:hypothetical protein
MGFATEVGTRNLGGTVMGLRLRTMALAGVLPLAGLVIAGPSAQAQCGGGYGRAWGGYSHGYYGGGYGCWGGGCGMMMGSMAMGGVPMSLAQAPMTSMPSVNMNGYAARSAATAPAASVPSAPASVAPQPAAASYYCPMHPGVMSTFPANCPYCSMALKKR